MMAKDARVLLQYPRPVYKELADMTELEFRRELWAIPLHLSETEQRMRSLATEYHDTCERFDQSICRRIENGIAKPTTAFELAEVSRNARSVLKGIFSRERMTITERAALCRAIADAKYLARE